MNSQEVVAHWQKLCLEAIKVLGDQATGRAIHDHAKQADPEMGPQFAPQTYTALDRLITAGTIKFLGQETPRIYVLL